MGKNIIHSIYQEYCDSMEEGRETKFAAEEMEKGIRGLCDEQRRSGTSFWITKRFPMRSGLRKASGAGYGC